MFFWSIATHATFKRGLGSGWPSETRQHQIGGAVESIDEGAIMCVWGEGVAPGRRKEMMGGRFTRAFFLSS
jgi:hypothetical protein